MSHSTQIGHFGSEMFFLFTPIAWYSRNYI